MKTMIKRADGSYSQRGLWDNIRANKGSGKKPTKAMLKQEKKIKSKFAMGGEADNMSVQYPALQSPNTSLQSLASNSLGAPVNTPQETQPQSAFRKGGLKNKKSESMKTMYKKAGKAPKKMRESFLEESKEIHFGAPKKKFLMGGGPGDPPAAGTEEKVEPVKQNAADLLNQKQDKYAKLKSNMSEAELDYFNSQSERKQERMNKKSLKENYKLSTELKDIEREKKVKAASGEQSFREKRKEDRASRREFQLEKIKAGQQAGTGFKNVAEGAGEVIEKGSGAVQDLYRLDKKQERTGGKRSYMGGGKSMKPGGGGRFAALVGKLKGKGKSEESAEAIAASVGRKKYGKNKFQAMAAAGKARMGGKKC